MIKICLVRVAYRALLASSTPYPLPHMYLNVQGSIGTQPTANKFGTTLCGEDHPNQVDTFPLAPVYG